MATISKTQPTETCRSQVFLQGENLVIADTSLSLQLVALGVFLLFTGAVAFYSVEICTDPYFFYYVLLPVSALVCAGLGAVGLTGGERRILDRSQGRFTRGIHLAFGILLDTTSEIVGLVTAVSIVTETRAVLIKKTGGGGVAPAPHKICQVQLVHLPANSRDPKSLELFYTTEVGNATRLGQRVATLLKVPARESRIR